MKPMLMMLTLMPMLLTCHCALPHSSLPPCGLAGSRPRACDHDEDHDLDEEGGDYGNAIVIIDE